MSRVSSCRDIRLHEGVLGERPEAVIDTGKVDDRAWWRDFARAERLDAPRPHRAERGVRAEGRKRGDLGPAAAPDSPRLLKDPGEPATLGVALRDVVIPARREQPR